MPPSPCAGPQSRPTNPASVIRATILSAAAVATAIPLPITWTRACGRLIARIPDQQDVSAALTDSGASGLQAEPGCCEWEQELHNQAAVSVLAGAAVTPTAKAGSDKHKFRPCSAFQ